MRRLTRWIVTSWPLPLLQHPFEVFLGGLCVLSGLPLVLATQPDPASLTATLPWWIVKAWGIELTLGGALIVLGVIWPRMRYAERAGLTLLAPAAGLYALAIFVNVGRSGLVAASIVLAFALACLLRLAVVVEVRRVIHREVEQS